MCERCTQDERNGQAGERSISSLRILQTNTASGIARRGYYCTVFCFCRLKTKKVTNYVSKQFRRYTASDIYGIANCELEFYLVNRLANDVFVGKEVDYTCVNAEDEKFLTLEILDKINVIIQ